MNDKYVRVTKQNEYEVTVYLNPTYINDEGEQGEIFIPKPLKRKVYPNRAARRAAKFKGESIWEND